MADPGKPGQVGRGCGPAEAWGDLSLYPRGVAPDVREGEGGTRGRDRDREGSEIRGLCSAVPDSSCLRDAGQR